MSPARQPYAAGMPQAINAVLLALMCGVVNSIPSRRMNFPGITHLCVRSSFG